jgi:type III secretion protein N (ATPase)
VLSRKLGSANHHPAIDILASVSRLMTAIATRITSGSRVGCASSAKYQEVELLVGSVNKPGSDAVTDEAIARSGDQWISQTGAPREKFQ